MPRLDTQRIEAIRARLEAARPLPDTGHSGVCTCKECRACWDRATAFQDYAPRALDDIADLLEEVERARGDERRRIVEWLCDACENDERHPAWWVAVAIERGDHAK